MKKLTLGILLAFVISMVAMPVSAATLLSGETINISEKQSEDVYAAGSQLIVDEAVAGDLVVAGADISANGDVAEDFMAGAAVVRLSGNVADDLRVGAGNLTIGGDIGGDALAAGGTLVLSKGSTIQGDALLAGGVLTLDGDIASEALITGDEIIINGNINGAADIRGRHIVLNGSLSGDIILAAESIELGTQANIGGDVSYYTDNGEMDFSSALQGGTATFDSSLKYFSPAGPTFSQTLGGAALWFLVSLAGAALVLLLIVLLMPKLVSAAATQLATKFWVSLGVGALFFVAAPIIILLLLITVIGIPLGLFGMFVYAFSVYAASIVTSAAIGKWLEQKLKKNWGKASLFFISLGILVAIKLLGLIPFVGWLIVMLIAFAGFGAVLLAKRARYKKVEGSAN